MLMEKFLCKQRVGQDWATELNWTEEYLKFCDIRVADMELRNIDFES